MVKQNHNYFFLPPQILSQFVSFLHLNIVIKYYTAAE